MSPSTALLSLLFLLALAFWAYMLFCAHELAQYIPAHLFG